MATTAVPQTRISGGSFLLEERKPDDIFTPEDFTEPEIFFQIGVDPVRVDILTSVLGLEFDAAWARKIEVDFGGVQAPVLCRDDILAAKGRLRPAPRQNRRAPPSRVHN